MTHSFGFFDEKMTILRQQHQLLSSSFQISLRSFPTTAVQYLRIHVCNSAAELDVIASSVNALITFLYFHFLLIIMQGIENENYVSIQNDILALKFLLQVLENAFTDISAESSIESDLEQLKTLDSGTYSSSEYTKLLGSALNYEDYRLRPALNYRITRKNIAALSIVRIKQVVSLLETLLPIFEVIVNVIYCIFQ